MGDAGVEPEGSGGRGFELEPDLEPEAPELEAFGSPAVAAS